MDNLIGKSLINGLLYYVKLPCEWERCGKVMTNQPLDHGTAGRQLGRFGPPRNVLYRHQQVEYLRTVIAEKWRVNMGIS